MELSNIDTTSITEDQSHVFDNCDSLKSSDLILLN
jgi:hypothetical protein